MQRNALTFYTFGQTRRMFFVKAKHVNFSFKRICCSYTELLAILCVKTTQTVLS